jgi:thiol-disulfide isomerase/thioredoxin
MSADRALVLLGLAAGAAVVMGVYLSYRKRHRPGPERLSVEDLGLELMAGCCAFVVFTTPACAPCKAALRVVRSAATSNPGSTEVTTVDAVERSDLAIRYDVRTIPTVFLITASGRVVRCWRNVPDAEDVGRALAALE